MNNQPHLTRAQRLMVDKTLRRLRPNADWINLDVALSKWAEFVEDVESGYAWPDYEYINDLSVRDILEDLLCNCDEATREALTAAIKPLDERFWAASRHGQGSLWKGREGEWWSRVPLNPCADLEEDLRHRGVW